MIYPTMMLAGVLLGAILHKYNEPKGPTPV